jgi:hypothetical protein
VSKLQQQQKQALERKVDFAVPHLWDGKSPGRAHADIGLPREKKRKKERKCGSLLPARAGLSTQSFPLFIALI